MTNINWVFSRDTSAVAPDYSHLGPNHGVVLNANDPNLAKQVAAAQKAGVPYSIWVPATSDGGDPVAYARTLSKLQTTYHPTLLVPDLEFGQKGGQGSAGWKWNDAMMAEARRLGISPQQLAITVMPNQNGGVFNYGAYKGAQIWPQSYGAKLTNTFDPNEVVHTVTGSGVDPSLVHPVLAPGQNYAGGDANYYTWDDMTPAQQQAFEQSNPAAAAAAAASPTTPVSGGQTMPNHIPDSQNPAAIAYSKAKLKQLAKLGYTPEQYGLQGLDVTAQYRALSAILGARQAIKSGHAADYQLRPSTPDSVAQTVNQLLQMAQTPENGPDNGAVAPGSVPVNPDAAAAVSHPLWSSAMHNMDLHGARAATGALVSRASGRAMGVGVPFGTGHAGAVENLNDPYLAATHAHVDAAHSMMNAAKNLGPMQAAIHIAAALRMLRQQASSQAVAPTYHGGPQ